jgi:hypothetical protein
LQNIAQVVLGFRRENNSSTGRHLASVDVLARSLIPLLD